MRCSGRFTLFCLDRRLEPKCDWQRLWGYATLQYGLDPTCTPHARHFAYWWAQGKGSSHWKKMYSSVAECKVATHWIVEVRADVMRLYQQPSYTAHFTEALAKLYYIILHYIVLYCIIYHLLYIKYYILYMIYYILYII